MRALCGAIITAGALLGLGLTVVGIGMRYQIGGHQAGDPSGDRLPVLKDKAPQGENTDLFEIRHQELDNPMKVAMFVTVSCVVIGLGITFLGLAYHHERRHRERAHGHGHGHGEVPPRVTV